MVALANLQYRVFKGQFPNFYIKISHLCCEFLVRFMVIKSEYLWQSKHKSNHRPIKSGNVNKLKVLR